MKFGMNLCSSRPAKHYGLLFSLLLIITSLLQCKQTDKKLDSSETTFTQSTKKLPKDFLEFYEKFHSDSIYQINHIVWPLRGIPRIKDQSVEDLENFHWQKDTWVMHQKPDMNHGDYIIKYDLSVPNIITEHILIRNTDLRMMRRFARSNNGEWFLIFYTHLNEFNGDLKETKSSSGPK